MAEGEGPTGDFAAAEDAGSLAERVGEAVVGDLEDGLLEVCPGAGGAAPACSACPEELGEVLEVEDGVGSAVSGSSFNLGDLASRARHSSISSLFSITAFPEENKGLSRMALRSPPT